MTAMRDLAGLRFGRLTAIMSPRSTKTGKRIWECYCDCGATSLVHASNLTTGHTSSCGCLERELFVPSARTSHGKRHTRTYATWSQIKTRCHNPKYLEYQYYGGRGISVCQRWRESFDAFLADMGERPPGMSIDRFPNNDGDYEPSNCRWATPIEQANNRRLPSRNRLGQPIDRIVARSIEDLVRGIE